MKMHTIADFIVAAAAAAAAAAGYYIRSLVSSSLVIQQGSRHGKSGIFDRQRDTA